MPRDPSLPVGSDLLGPLANVSRSVEQEGNTRRVRSGPECVHGVSVAHDMSGLYSTRSVRFILTSLEVADAPDGSPTGCSYAEVHGRIWPPGRGGAEPGGGVGIAGRWRTDLPTLVPSLRGRRRGRAAGPSDRQGIGSAGASGSVRGGRAFVSNALSGLHCAAFPRTSGGRPPFRLELQLDEGLPAKPEFAAESGASRRPPAQAASSSAAGNDAASGRVAPRVAGRGPAARSGGHDGRCHERDLLSVSGRGRRHCVNVPSAAGGVRTTRPAAEPVYGSRQSLLSHRRRRRQGGSRPADPGRARAGTSGRRAHRGVFAPGARPLGAFVPDLAGSRAEGTGAGGHHDDG